MDETTFFSKDKHSDSVVVKDMIELPAEELLDTLAIRPTWTNRNLKKLEISDFNTAGVLEDLITIQQLARSYKNSLEKYSPYRVKTSSSVLRKVSKYRGSGRQLKSILNDFIGFRMKVSTFNIDIPSNFRVVDLSTSKQIDDGYRAVHLYYNKDTLCYPIEVQLWLEEDYDINYVMHDVLYKKSTPEECKRFVELARSLQRDMQTIDNLTFLADEIRSNSGNERGGDLGGK